MGVRVRHRGLRGLDLLRRILQGRCRRRSHAVSNVRARDVRFLGAALVLLLGATAGVADVYVMTDGDRITGKTLSQAAGFYKVDTPYGRIAVPRGRVAKVIHDDGREEIVNGVASVRPSQPAATTSGGVHLVVVVTGASFWQAWREGEIADPSLRLQISLDEEPIARYVDNKLDPEIPGATVNSFSFASGDTTFSPGPGVHMEPPETRPGRIALKIDLPAEKAGERRFRLAYQANDGSVSVPAWRDLVDSLIHVTLKTETPSIVEIRQNQGKMEFSGFGKKKMKGVETFLIEAKTQ
jgi:hypothetical protein